MSRNLSAHPSPKWHTALPGRTVAPRASREPLHARGLATEINGQTPPLCCFSEARLCSRCGHRPRVGGPALAQRCRPASLLRAKHCDALTRDCQRTRAADRRAWRTCGYQGPARHCQLLLCGHVDRQQRGGTWVASMRTGGEGLEGDAPMHPCIDCRRKHGRKCRPHFHPTHLALAVVRVGRCRARETPCERRRCARAWGLRAPAPSSGLGGTPRGARVNVLIAGFILNRCHYSEAVVHGVAC